MKCLHCGEFIAGEITKIVSKIYFSPSFVVMLFCYSVRFSFVVWIIFLGISLQRPGGTILLRIFERVFLDLQFFFFFFSHCKTLSENILVCISTSSSPPVGLVRHPSQTVTMNGIVLTPAWLWHRHTNTHRSLVFHCGSQVHAHTHTQTHSHDF